MGSPLLQFAPPLARGRSRRETHRRGRSKRRTAIAGAALRSRKRNPWHTLRAEQELRLRRGVRRKTASVMMPVMGRQTRHDYDRLGTGAGIRTLSQRLPQVARGVDAATLARAHRSTGERPSVRSAYPGDDHLGHLDTGERHEVVVADPGKTCMRFDPGAASNRALPCESGTISSHSPWRTRSEPAAHGCGAESDRRRGRGPAGRTGSADGQARGRW